MNLRARAIRGVQWTAISSATTTVLFFIQTVVLARLLEPEDFGLVAMVMVVVMFALSFADAGISNAIIRETTIDSVCLSSAYWISLGMGTLLCIAVLLLAPAVAGFYQEPLVVPLLAWASLIFVSTPLGSHFEALLLRELEFKTIAVVTIVAALAGLAIAVTAASLGFGALSIVWGQLANVVVKSLQLAVIGWRRWTPGIVFNWREVRPLWTFGLYQMGERSINQVSANLDYLLIGRFLGPAALGVYTLAYQLAVVPLRRINPVLVRVAFPVFVRRQDDHGSLRAGYLELARLIATVSFPLLAGMALCAPLLIPVLFGAGWQRSVLLLQILAIVGAVKVLGNPDGAIYLALGRPDIGLKWNAAIAVLNAAALLVAVRFSVEAVAVTLAALYLLYLMASRKVLDVLIQMPISRYVKALLAPAISSLGMAIIVMGVLALSIEPPAVKLVAAVTAGGAGYFATYLVLDHAYFRQLLTLWRSREN